MTNLISYSLFFLGNFLTIIFIPDTIINVFLANFSIFSLIIGPINFLIFSKLLEKKFTILKTILLLNFASLFFVNDFKILILIYTINIFFSDFLSSQLKFPKLNFLYKLIFFLISFLLIFDLANIEEILLIRVILSSILLTLVLIFKLKHVELKIKYPIIYQFSTNINYYLPLYFTTLILEMFFLKLVYVIFQIGFGLILKTYDLRIRKIINENTFNRYNKFLYLVITILPLIFLYFKIPVLIYFLYYVSVLIFIFIKKKFL